MDPPAVERGKIYTDTGRRVGCHVARDVRSIRTRGVDLRVHNLEPPSRRSIRVGDVGR